MEKGRVSVIVPLYNKEKWVFRCIDSIINQTYKNLEILVVNDGSTDGSSHVVASINDSRIRILDKENGGLSTARNFGIENAKGEFIALLDADDEWGNEHVEKLLDGFNQGFENVVLVCSDLVETLDGVKENSIEKDRPHGFKRINDEVNYILIDDYLSTLMNGYFLLSGSSVMLKSKVIKDFNIKFESASEPAEDNNYWLRLNKYGQFVFCNYVGLFYHRVDENSIMNKKKNTAQLVPPFFHGIDISHYSKSDQKIIKHFLQKEYYKKAYQNRGLLLRKEELSLSNVTKMNHGFLLTIIYLCIRYFPSFTIKFYKKIKKLFN